MGKVRKIEITYVKWRSDFESKFTTLKYLSQDVVNFLKEYGYRVSKKSFSIIITNKKYVPVPIYILLMIVGMTGIVLGIMSTYKMLLLSVLLVFIPLLKIMTQSGRRVVFDFMTQRINDIPFSEIEVFQYKKSEQFAHATPFEEGTIEYTADLEVKTKNGSITRLVSFVDRQEKKEGLHKVLADFQSMITT